MEKNKIFLYILKIKGNLDIPYLKYLIKKIKYLEKLISLFYIEKFKNYIFIEIENKILENEKIDLLKNKKISSIFEYKNFEKKIKKIIEKYDYGEEIKKYSLGEIVKIIHEDFYNKLGEIKEIDLKKKKVLLNVKDSFFNLDVFIPISKIKKNEKIKNIS